VTFELGTDVNMDQVLVQNRVAIAEPTLPDVVRTIGVSTKKRSPDVFLGINLYSDDNPETGRPYYDALYLSNYATINVKDAVAQVEGVGDVVILGQQDYSMRAWLDPDKLQSRNLTVEDVIQVLREQNVQVAAGQIGQPPVPRGQDFQYTLSTLGRLVEADQFADIVLKTGSDGEVTYLKDVSRTDLGARNQDTVGRLDGRPSVALVEFLLPGANALDTGDRIKAKMRELETRFPRGLRYAVIYDTTPFIRESVNEVFHTLRDAVILVAVVISRCAPPTATWFRWGRWPRCATPPGRSRSPGTTCSRRPRSTAPRCRGSAPATSCTRWRACRTRSFRATWSLSGPS